MWTINYFLYSIMKGQYIIYLSFVCTIIWTIDYLFCPLYGQLVLTVLFTFHSFLFTFPFKRLQAYSLKEFVQSFLHSLSLMTCIPCLLSLAHSFLFLFLPRLLRFLFFLTLILPLSPLFFHLSILPPRSPTTIILLLLSACFLVHDPRPPRFLFLITGSPAETN